MDGKTYPLSNPYKPMVSNKFSSLNTESNLIVSVDSTTEWALTEKPMQIQTEKSIKKI